MVNPGFPKEGRVKLEDEAYREFRDRILERDGWRCRNPKCGSRWWLTVHHKIKRSRLRLDTEENCITLCLRCHELVEAHKLEVEEWW